MKWKIVLTFAISACLVVGLSIYALAGSIPIGAGTPTTFQSPQGTDTGITISPSPKVIMDIETNSGTLYDATGSEYAIGSCHINGDKVFGSASNDGHIYFQGVAAGSGCTASSATPSASNSTAFNGWSSI